MKGMVTQTALVVSRVRPVPSGGASRPAVFRGSSAASLVWSPSKQRPGAVVSYARPVR